MKNYLRLSKVEFRHEVTYLAKTCAYLRFQRDHPFGTDWQAYDYAHDNWHGYIDMALDIMAILQVKQEQDLFRPSVN
jgi:hypothetical protein